MSWKKNIFSYLVWAVYLLVTGTAMTFTGSAICGSIGVSAYIGSIAAAACLLFSGLIVFAVHKTAVKLKGTSQSGGKVFLWLEGVLTAALIAAGLFLRAVRPPADPDGSVFLDLAYVSSDGQTIPLFDHGAVYFYILTLRLAFILLGNKVAVALGLQLALQMLAVLMLYFAVRKMAGRVSAVIMMAFFMLSPYMAEKTAFVSPQMLYLFVFSVVLLYISRGVDRVSGWGFWLFAGIMTAYLIYLDAAGLLMILLMLGVIFAEHREAENKIVVGMLGAAAGLSVGTAVCILADVLSSSKSVLGIIEAWVKLYRFGEPPMAVSFSDFGTVWPVILLLCFMAWGIFSFWCRRRAESFSIWIFCLVIAALMQCLGVFTEEMSGTVYIFFFSTVLAGLGVRESASVYEAEDNVGQTTVFPELEVEELGEDEDVKEEKETVAEEKKTEDKQEQKEPEKKREIEYIENPLPLPKKHVKRVMDYALDSETDSKSDRDGYDIYVSDDDDFDH